MSHYCYECGDRPAKPEKEMQKYDCVVCGGRKCTIHTVIDENLTCDYCGQDELCNNCLGFARCCHDFIDGKFVKRNPELKIS